jgi:hypothetical protein
MKTIKLLIGTLFLLPLFSFTNSHSNIQSTNLEELIITAVFDGHEDYGYNFIAKNENNEEYTLTFQEVKEEVLNTFDLSAEAFIGTKFKVTYTHVIVKFKDADGFEDEKETNTIIKLEKL